MPAVLPRLYLLAYNLLQFAGWAVALYRLGGHLIATRSLEGSYAVAGDVVGACRPRFRCGPRRATPRQL